MSGPGCVWTGESRQTPVRSGKRGRDGTKGRSRGLRETQEGEGTGSAALCGTRAWTTGTRGTRTHEQRDSRVFLSYRLFDDGVPLTRVWGFSLPGPPTHPRPPAHPPDPDLTPVTEVFPTLCLDPGLSSPRRLFPRGTHTRRRGDPSFPHSARLRTACGPVVVRGDPDRRTTSRTPCRRGYETPVLL